MWIRFVDNPMLQWVPSPWASRDFPFPEDAIPQVEVNGGADQSAMAGRAGPGKDVLRGGGHLAQDLPAFPGGRVLALDVPNVFIKEQIQSRFLVPCRSCFCRGGAQEWSFRWPRRSAPTSRNGRRPRPSWWCPERPEPQLRLRHLRGGQVQPPGHAASQPAESPGVAYNPCSSGGGAGEDPPHARHRPLRLRECRGPVVYVSSSSPTSSSPPSKQPNPGLQGEIPQRGRAPHRRHPVSGG